MALRRRVEVAVRVRAPEQPSSSELCISTEATAGVISIDDEAGRHTGAGRRSYREDIVFDATISNDAIFERLILQKMKHATPEQPDTLCFLAYGHTSSGKTHTITGTEEEPGVLTMSVAELLRREGVVEAAMLEVYMDGVYDLLSHGEARRVRRRQGASGAIIVVEDLCTCTITSMDQWQAVSSFATRSRRTAPTERNARSSRSHAMFTLKSNGVRLCLVDLAGSERQTVFSPQLNRESISINKSLSRLSTVLEALSHQVVGEDGRRSYVNFRDTTLTVLLQRYLTGASMTTFLACVHPSALYYHETISTLRYTQRLKRIKTRVAQPNVDEWSMMQAGEHEHLLEELVRLRQQVQQTDNATRLVEVAHQRRIAELEAALVMQQRHGGGLSSSSLPGANSARTRDTRRVAGWLLSRVLGELPELNVGYDNYFDHLFPPFIQVIGYVSTMACLVPRTAEDPPLLFLDVGDFAMGLSMMDAGIPPLVCLHEAGCGQPSAWEMQEWGTEGHGVYVLAFFESSATATEKLHRGKDKDALPCCGGYVSSEPLLPIAAVLCVAKSMPMPIKEKVLQRLIDLQCEQEEAVERQYTGAPSSLQHLSSDDDNGDDDDVPNAAALLDDSLHRGKGSSGSLSDDHFSLPMEVQRQVRSIPHVVSPYQIPSSTASRSTSIAKESEETGPRILRDEVIVPPSVSPLQIHLSVHQPKEPSETVAAEVPPIPLSTLPATAPQMSSTAMSLSMVAPSSTPSTLDQRQLRHSRGEGKAVKMEKCHGCIVT